MAGAEAMHGSASPSGPGAHSDRAGGVSLGGYNRYIDLAPGPIAGAALVGPWSHGAAALVVTSGIRHHCRCPHDGEEVFQGVIPAGP